MTAKLRSLREEREAGFTLIELLIVIVIIGILAAIVVFSVQGITDRGAKSACQQNANEAQTAVEAYYAQNKAYPATLTSLVPSYLKTDPTGAQQGGGNISYASATGTVTGTC